MRVVAMALALLTATSPASAVDEKLAQDCLEQMVDSMRFLPAEIRYIEVGGLSGGAPGDAILFRRIISDNLAASERFKLSEDGQPDAVMHGNIESLPGTILDREGVRVSLELTSSSSKNLLWAELLSCRRYRRIRLSLATGATLSQAKFCRIRFFIYEQTPGGHRLFSDFDTSAEVWPPAAIAKLELSSRSRLLTALVFYASVARINAGGIDGQGGGETPVSLEGTSGVRPIDCDLGGSFCTLLGGQWKFSPARLATGRGERFFVSLGAGAMYYKLNYELTLTGDYFNSGEGRSETVTPSGFLPGAVFLFSFELPVTPHLAAFYDYAQYGETTSDVPRGEIGGADMFSYELTVAKNRLYTVGIRFAY